MSIAKIWYIYYWLSRFKLIISKAYLNVIPNHNYGDENT